MSVSVTVSIGETIQVDASTDAKFSPDVLDDLLAHAGRAALNAYGQLDVDMDD
jgi:hypothetical protein